MIARNHWKCSLGAWFLVGTAAEVTGLLVPGATLALAPVGASAGLGPDLDFPPEGGKPGATPAEAHGLASNALAHLISSTHRGHRGLTHRYWYAALVAALVALLGVRYPIQTGLVLIGWWTAWPLYCQLPHRWRWTSAFWAAGLALLMGWRGWLPETHALAVAAGMGWAMHIVCDHFQSLFTKLARRVRRLPWLADFVRETFGLGSPGEACVAWASLAAGLAAWLLITNPNPLS